MVDVLCTACALLGVPAFFTDDEPAVDLRLCECLESAKRPVTRQLELLII